MDAHLSPSLVFMQREMLALFLLFLSFRVIHSSFTTDVLRPEFERAFNEQCTAAKYPFIKDFFEIQKNSTDRYIYFIMQEPGFDTRGLGDRVAALLTAAAIAVRFRRKLIIQTSDGFDKLFVPHRADYAAGPSAYNSWISFHCLNIASSQEKLSYSRLLQREASKVLI